MNPHAQIEPNITMNNIGSDGPAVMLPDSTGGRGSEQPLLETTGGR